MSSFRAYRALILVHIVRQYWWAQFRGAMVVLLHQLASNGLLAKTRSQTFQKVNKVLKMAIPGISKPYFCRNI